jgi:hypothetical protein
MPTLPTLPMCFMIWCDLFIFQIRPQDFESALETFGIRALLERVIRISHNEMQPMLKSFRRSWSLLEIDRVRIKSPGLTMRSASVLVALCHALYPPNEYPQDKLSMDALTHGPRCSVWASVLALRELGAFTDDRGA